MQLLILSLFFAAFTNAQVQGQSNVNQIGDGQLQAPSAIPPHFAASTISRPAQVPEKSGMVGSGECTSPHGYQPIPTPNTPGSQPSNCSYSGPNSNSGSGSGNHGNTKCNSITPSSSCIPIPTRTGPACVTVPTRTGPACGAIGGGAGAPSTLNSGIPVAGREAGPGCPKCLNSGGAGIITSGVEDTTFDEFIFTAEGEIIPVPICGEQAPAVFKGAASKHSGGGWGLVVLMVVAGAVAVGMM